jgi:hypothetical protein
MASQTDAELSGLNLKLDPVEKIIFSGIQQSCMRVFRAPTVWATSTDKIQAVNRLFNNGRVSYPYMTLQLNSVTSAEGRGNNRHTAMKGEHVVISDDNRRSFRLTFLPVDFQIEVEFVSQTHEDTLRFTSDWMFARQLGFLKFEAAYGRTSFGVGIEMDSTVTIPLRDGDADTMTTYTLNTMFTVQGFMSRATLLEGQIITDVTSVTSVPNDDGTFSDITDPIHHVPPETTTWSFPTSSNSR